MNPSTILLLLLSLLLTQCSWLLPKKEAQPELPPPTQEGKNTFGCYLNGKSWAPKGRLGFGKSSLKMNIDPSFRGGHLSVIAYWYEEGKVDQKISFYVDSIPKYGAATYPFSCVVSGPYIDGGSASFTDDLSACQYYYCNDDSRIVSGHCTVTRYDLVGRVVSGTFEFTLAKPGCDTVRVTDGRFDLPVY